MLNQFSHQYLDDRHFTKNNLEGLYLQQYYKDCKYSMHIYLSASHQFNSITVETAHKDRETSLVVVSETRNHAHKDRKSVGALLCLLASKLKFDLLSELDIDNAGFLHSTEITKLYEKGITRVPTTIYRGITKLLRKSLKAPKSPETSFLSKFLFEPYQFWHLVNWHGKIGANKEEADTLWWLNIPPNNIHFYDKKKTPITDEDILKGYLKSVFPKKCLLLKREIKEFCERYIEETSDNKTDQKNTKADNGDATTEANADNNVDVEITPKYEPKTLIVDASQQGDFAKISDAIKSASPGDRIMVRPGSYNEAIVLDKAVEIIGEGKREDIVISFCNYCVAMIRTPKGKFSNLTLKQLGGKNMSCINIRAGGCEVDSCEISSAESNGIDISGNAEPRIKRCHIHHCGMAGISVEDSSAPVIEGNKICNVKFSGIIVRGASSPTIRKNRIYESMQGGIYIYGSSTGLILNNKIYNNTYSGIAIKDGSRPIVKLNTIAKNGHFGIEVFKGGGCIIDDNNVFDNKVDNIDVSPDSVHLVEFKKNEH